MTVDNRRHIRIDSLNLSYVCIDEEGEAVNEGMGRTLNVSESGILLEAPFVTSTRQSMALTIALNEEIIELTGRVVHCRPGENGMCETGVEFFQMEEATFEVLKKFVLLFKEQHGLNS